METKVIVNVGLTDGVDVALVEYDGLPDGEGGLMLPSTVVSAGDDIEEVVEALFKDTFAGVDAQLRVVAAESFVGRDGTWHVAITYVAKVSQFPAQKEVAGVSRQAFGNPQSLRSEKIAHRGWTLALVDQCLSR